jgi:hypothetical protein
MIDFTFHDIKAISISDFGGNNKEVFLGQKTEEQAQNYDRSMKITPTLNQLNLDISTSVYTKLFGN